MVCLERLIIFILLARSVSRTVLVALIYSCLSCYQSMFRPGEAITPGQAGVSLCKKQSDNHADCLSQRLYMPFIEQNLDGNLLYIREAFEAVAPDK